MTAGLESGLQRAINDFARWQGAEEIVLRQLPATLFANQRQGWGVDAA